MLPSGYAVTGAGALVPGPPPVLPYCDVESLHVSSALLFGHGRLRRCVEQVQRHSAGLGLMCGPHDLIHTVAAVVHDDGNGSAPGALERHLRHRRFLLGPRRAKEA